MCLVCATRGDTEMVLTAVADESVAHFPILRTLRPPPGTAADDNSGSTAALCHLCAQLLHHQWQMQHKRNIPVQQRQYWLKGSTNRTAVDVPSSPPPTTAASTPPPPIAAISSCTVCGQPVPDGEGTVQISPLLLSLVPDFASRYTPSSLLAQSAAVPLCSVCACNDGLRTVLQLISDDEQQQQHTATSVGALIFHLLRQQPRNPHSTAGAADIFPRSTNVATTSAATD